MRADYGTQLADDFLVKVDVSGMAASVESRAPFLAPALVDAAWVLPDSMKVRPGATKWLLKRIAARHLPREIVYRKKMGFALPLGAWFRRGLGDVLQELLRDSRLAQLGWVSIPLAQHALAEHRAHTRDHSHRLWLVLWLELWLRVVLDGSLKPSDSLRDVVAA